MARNLFSLSFSLSLSLSLARSLLSPDTLTPEPSSLMQVCDQCIPGTFAARSRMTSCNLCAVREFIYNLLFRIHFIIAHPPQHTLALSHPPTLSHTHTQVGNFTEAFKASACLDCPSGTTTRGKNARLKRPADGAAREDENGLPFLVPDWFNDEIDDCLDQCRAGTYSIWGVPPCLACPGGRFSNRNGSTVCTPCPSGFSSVSGATVCTQCLAGLTQTPVYIYIYI